MEGAKPIVINPGDTDLIPPNVKRWHGLARDRLLIHFALREVTDEGARTQWLEKVSDAEYNAPALDPD